jgi:DNA-binding IclR family transcriptional regulator
MQALMVQTHETAHLAVHVDGEVMYLDSEQHGGIITVTTTVGGRAPMHSSAVGKALLLGLHSEEVDRILAVKGLQRFTDKTIVNPREFHEHLRQCRENGYGVDDEETNVGVRCIAAPVFDHRDRVVAAVGISGPTQRMPLERIPILAHVVKECAAKISQQLGFLKIRGEVSGSLLPDQRNRAEGRVAGELDSN